MSEWVSDTGRVECVQSLRGGEGGGGTGQRGLDWGTKKTKRGGVTSWLRTGFWGKIGRSLPVLSCEQLFSASSTSTLWTETDSSLSRNSWAVFKVGMFLPFFFFLMFHCSPALTFHWPLYTCRLGEDCVSVCAAWFTCLCYCTGKKMRGNSTGDQKGRILPRSQCSEIRRKFALVFVIWSAVPVKCSEMPGMQSVLSGSCM